MTISAKDILEIRSHLLALANHDPVLLGEAFQHATNPSGICLLAVARYLVNRTNPVLLEAIDNIADFNRVAACPVPPEKLRNALGHVLSQHENALALH